MIFLSKSIVSLGLNPCINIYLTKILTWRFTSRAGKRLPRNFELIALQTAMIDKLEGMNIKYDKITGQREDAEE